MFRKLKDGKIQDFLTPFDKLNDTISALSNDPKFKLILINSIDHSKQLLVNNLSSKTHLFTLMPPIMLITPSRNKNKQHKQYIML